MAFEGLDAPATLRASLRDAAGGAELPHLDGLIQAATDKITAVRRERHTIDAILVTIRSLKALDKVTSGDLPHTHALVERPSRHVLGIGRDCHRGDAVFDGQGEDVGRLLDIPEPDCTITTARRDSSAITGKVQRVDILLVTRKCVPDGSRRDIPDL